MKAFFRTSGDWAPTLLRVTLGVVMFTHGAQKLLGWFDGFGLPATLEGFQQALGLPLALAMLIVIGEFFGSLGLIFGFLTRFSAASIAAIMVGAISLGHWNMGFFMNWTGQQPGEGFEFHILVMAMALALVITGGGRASVDGIVAERLSRADRRQPVAIRERRAA